MQEDQKKFKVLICLQDDKNLICRRAAYNINNNNNDQVGAGGMQREGERLTEKAISGKSCVNCLKLRG